ncbi:MAG: VCBS repeat-containing protein, partial [Anaerolineales bacterium]|nr:VCBS repeat-containing protein [Anaerolineales bacterium]
IVLEHNGQVKSGWPFRTRDEAVAPLGCTDTVYSTPALGDLDRDGDMEIVFGSFDKGLYALHHNGTLVTGFPITSAHYPRFGWDILIGRVADTIWSSPALADLDQDGYLDIVIGTDEGYFGNSYPGGSLNWSCPYLLPAGWASDYCGGSLYAVDRFGKSLPGFPRYMLETIQSSPAIDDVDGDGDFEIFVGTGTFYNTFSPSHPTNGYRLFGLDHRGND